MEPITINAPAGFVPVFDAEKSQITFTEAPKNIRERLNTWVDILTYHDMTEKKFAKWCEGLAPHEVGYRKEVMIAEAYNEGKKPNFDDDSYKRALVFDHSGGGFRFFCADIWNSRSDVGSRLLFVGPDAYENACDAAQKFLPEYKESRTL